MAEIFSRFADAVERVMQQSRRTVERAAAPQTFKQLAQPAPRRVAVKPRPTRDFGGDNGASEIYQDLIGESRGFEEFGEFESERTGLRLNANARVSPMRRRLRDSRPIPARDSRGLLRIGRQPQASQVPTPANTPMPLSGSDEPTIMDRQREAFTSPTTRGLGSALRNMGLNEQQAAALDRVRQLRADAMRIVDPVLRQHALALAMQEEEDASSLLDRAKSFGRRTLEAVGDIPLSPYQAPPRVRGTQAEPRGVADTARNIHSSPAYQNTVGLDIPYSSEIANVVGGIARGAYDIAQNTTPGFNTDPAKVKEERADRAAGVAEVFVPREAWEVAIELVPGIGTVPGVASWGRKALARALEEEGLPLTAAGVRALVSRKTPEGVREAITAGERGALELGGENILRAADEGVGGAGGAGDEALPIERAVDEGLEAAEQPLRTGSEQPVSATETGVDAPLAPDPVVRGGGSAGGPPGGLDDFGPITPGDRARVAKQIARGVERQGPEFVHQEAIRSQERSQRFAEVQRIRMDRSLTPEERNQAWRSALAGEYRKGEFTPLEISDADFSVAESMIRDSDLMPAQWVNALVALSRLRSGQGLRNFEQELLGQVFGPDLVAAIKKRNQSLAANIAQTWGVSADDVARAARQEEITRATGKVKQSGLDTAEQVASRRIDNLTTEAMDKAVQRRIAMQNKLAAAHLKDMEESIGRAVTRTGPAPERGATDIVRSGIRGRDGKIIQSGLDSYERQHPSVSDLMKRAGEQAPEEMRPVVSEAIRYWSEGNRAILDGVGETEGLRNMLRLVSSAFSGQVTDSYVASLASRRAFLEMALLREGVDPKDVGRIGQFMFDAEVTQRYGQNIPESVQRSIDMLKSPPLMGEGRSTTGTILEAMATGSEEVKNLMFGLDLGVFGIQARAAVQGGWIPELASLVNKTLTRMHAPHFGDLYLDSTLDRQTANMLDGVFHSFGAQGPEAVTRRGVVMSIPGYGKVVDKLSDFQFNTVLGGVRDTLYEGNLLLMHVLGRDVKNPRVRARAAEWANTLTGFAHGAQTGMRKKAERAFFISPSMTRAQFNEILSAGKLLSPTADPEQRILAALAIASYGTSWLAAGMLINNVIGIKDFEFDPSKPGAGTITTKIPGTGEQSIPFMANASLKRTFAQSLRALAESDEESLWQAWARYLTAREATAGRQGVGLLTGAGYTPEGRFSTDISREDLAKSLIPTPPVLQSAISEGVNPVRLGLESLGINTYERSDFDKADELIAKFDGDFQAALFDAEGRGETGTANIVKYRWKQDLEPTLNSYGLQLIPGEEKQSPRIEYDGLNKTLIPQYADRFRQELGIDVTGAANLSEIRGRFVEQEAPRYAQARGTSLSVARDEVRKFFNGSQVVMGTLEQQFRQDGTPSARTKDAADGSYKKGDPIFEHGDDGYSDVYDQRVDEFWARFPEIAAALRVLGVDH